MWLCIQKREEADFVRILNLVELCIGRATGERTVQRAISVYAFAVGSRQRMKAWALLTSRRFFRMRTDVWPRK